jgi:hypothetical protein
MGSLGPMLADAIEQVKGSWSCLGPCLLNEEFFFLFANDCLE